jgi:glycosyltransferase involved in cell wall biosynthesis
VRQRLVAGGLPADRIEVLPHFQTLPADQDLGVDEGYLLYFGRLSSEKGVYELLRAMVRLPHVPLVIAGEGPERPKLEALAKELNLNQVLFAGMVHGEKLQKLIAGCSFSVFPSHAYETLGKSILESYAWGRPVVARSGLASTRTLLSFPAPPEPLQPRRNVRVAFIGGRGLVSKYSGIESYYEQAGRELARLGHEVTIYCRSYFTPPLSTHNGMRVRRLPTIRSKHLETFVHTLLSTAHAMASDYDVVHYHCLGPALFSFLPRLTGKKTVVTVQGLDWQRGKWGRLASRVLRWGEAAAVSLPDATMVVSRTLQQHYQQQHGRDTIYVPNGATLDPRRLPRKLMEWDLEADNYVLFLGRFSPEKNCHLLIDAFETLHTNMKLVLAGGSSHSDSYVKSLRRHESAQVRFLPWVSGSDLKEIVSNAAMLVLPSEIEGLSLALLDAMAAGVCVLTSDIPENNEVVEDAGFTFRRGDQADLERMLDLLIHNPELRRQSAARERERIQSQYLWPAIARSIEAAYYNVLGWKIDKNRTRAPEYGAPIQVPASALLPASALQRSSLKRIPSS